MMILIASLIVFFVLAYFEASLLLWSSALLIVLFILSIWSVEFYTWLGFAWGIAIILVLVLNIRALRIMLISAPLFHRFRLLLPHMSKTEKEAIQAGAVGWESTLFSGKPDWQALYSLPTPQLDTRERDFIENEVSHVCSMIDDWKVTHEEMDLSEEVWTYLKDKGFFGMIIPKEYGGMAFSALAHSDVVAKIASRSISAAVTVMVPNSLGPAELLLSYGTDQQKTYYLPRLAKGEEIPCFALTGPRAGSDAGSIPDIGIICKQVVNGEERLGIRINWEKRYITLAPVATLLGLAFHLYDPDHLLGETEDCGITLALIPRNTKGVEVGRRHFPVNLSFMNGPVQGRDVFIELDSVIGGVDGIGKGWRMLMESLGAGRAISLPSLSVAAVKLMSRSTGAYAAIREQFHHAIGEFEGVKEALSFIAGSTYLMEATRTLVLAEVDAVKRPSVVSAIAKYNLTERMRKVVNHAMDVQGGSGICLGPKNLWGRIYQSIPVSITVEGANILTRSMIIFGQGSMRCHPYVLNEIEACQNNNHQAGVASFDENIFKHGRYFLRNLARSFLLALAKPVFYFSKKNTVQYSMIEIQRISSGFALLTDVLFMIYGGQLKIREHLSGRMADVFSELYMASATLKHYREKNKLNPDNSDLEDHLLEWSVDQCFKNAHAALQGVIANLENRWVRGLLYVFIYPLGLPSKSPDDSLQNLVASTLMSHSRLRDHLTQGIYLGGPGDPLENIDNLLARVHQVKAEIHAVRDLTTSGMETLSYEKMIQSAQEKGVINEEMALTLLQIEKDRDEIIRVDDFPQEYFYRREG